MSIVVQDWNIHVSYLGGTVDLPELESIAVRTESVHYTIYLASIFAVLVDDSYR